MEETFIKKLKISELIELPWTKTNRLAKKLMTYHDPEDFIVCYGFVTFTRIQDITKILELRTIHIQGVKLELRSCTEY